MKPCKHETEFLGCRLCELYATHPEYRQIWGGNPAEIRVENDEARKARQQAIRERVARAKTPCVFLGPMVEERPSCGCGPRHICFKHENCVRTGTAAYWPSCSTCSDYQAQSQTV